MLSLVHPCHDLFAPALFRTHDALLAHLARGLPASPRLHLSETDAGYTLEAELPGAKPSDVKASVEGRELIVSAKTLSSHFVHRFTLPDDADADKMNAACENGVLRIEVARMEAEEFEVGLVDPDSLPSDGDHYHQRIAAPGVAPADLKIACVGGHIEIEGRTEARGTSYSIHRRYILPHDADKAGATASLAHGILTLVVPKRAQPEPRELAVDSGAAAAAPAAADAAAEDDFHMC